MHYPAPTHSDISGKVAALKNKAQRMGNSIRNTGKYVLEIRSGNHAGTILTLDPGTYNIGSGSENDIVLFADDMSKRHANFTLPSEFFKKTRITPVETNVTLQDGSVVDLGQYADLANQESFCLGETEILIQRIGNPGSLLRPFLRIVAAIALVALIVISYNVFSRMMVGAVNAGGSTISTISNLIREKGEGYIQELSGSDADPDAYLWAVRTKLEELGLHFKIRASQSGDGTIRVTGNIADSELERWTAFLRWYDEKTTFPSLVRDVTRGSDQTGLPQIKSVWLDDTPSVHFVNGNKAVVGDTLPTGWVVVKISREGVLLERDGAQVALTY